jgi:hypothetical protein
MSLDREEVITSLKQRGVVPFDCVDGPQYSFEPYFKNSGDRMTFFEPFPGPYMDGPEQQHGLHDRGRRGIPCYDHYSCMVEIHERKGIEFHMTRVIFSQPYFGVDFLGSLVEDVHDRLHLDMTIVENCAWYDPRHATLCVYTPVDPISFREFCHTFRYWLITNVVPPYYYELREGVLPPDMAPPTVLLDIIKNASRSMVVLGLHRETVDEAWDRLLVFHDFIEYETFEFLWNAYRSSLSMIPNLLAALFIGKLRVRVVEKKSFAPGGSNHLHSCREWNGMMDDMMCTT